MENQLREMLRGIAQDIPPQGGVPPGLRPRVRRRVAATIGLTVVIVGAVVLGGMTAVRSITGSSPVPVEPGPTVAPPMACGGPLPSSSAPPSEDDARGLNWPDTNRNPAGMYAWDGPGPIGDSNHLEGFIHNGYSKRPGDVAIWILGPDGKPVVPGKVVPHSGECVIVAGHEGTYRRFTGQGSSALSRSPVDRDDAVEEWVVDIEGTTIVITLVADPLTPKAEVADAHEIIESFAVDPAAGDLGFRLIFTVPTDTWDSG